MRDSSSFWVSNKQKVHSDDFRLTATVIFLNGWLSPFVMAMRIGGSRRKTRRLMKKDVRKRGKISLRAFFEPYKVGDGVILVGEPAVQTGMFHCRYWGKKATIEEKRGACYMVSIMDRKLKKSFVVHPVHLRRE